MLLNFRPVLSDAFGIENSEERLTSEHIGYVHVSFAPVSHNDRKDNIDGTIFVRFHHPHFHLIAVSIAIAIAIIVAVAAL